MNLQRYLTHSNFLTERQKEHLDTLAWLQTPNLTAASSGRTFLIAVSAILCAVNNPQLPIKVLDHVWDEECDRRMRAMLKKVLWRLDEELADQEAQLRRCFRIFYSTQNGPPIIVYEGGFTWDEVRPQRSTMTREKLTLLAEELYNYEGVKLEPIVPDIEIELLPPFTGNETWEDIQPWWTTHLWES